MRKTLLIILLLAVSSVAVYTVEAEPEKRFVANELIIGVEDISDAFLYEIESSGGDILEVIPSLSAIRVSVASPRENAFMAAVKGKPGVRYAERNIVFEALYTPNDPYWSDQWGMRIIQADLAWDIHQGSTSVIVAIIDTGVEYTHDDLSAHYVALGYDWVNNDNDPMDDNGHGTHVAGIAAAVMDNNIGVAGTAQVSVMAEKVLAADGTGTADDVAQGIVHAADQGAEVISISLGSYFSSKVLKDACQYAWNKGSLLVGAAGNDNVRWRHYPAAYDTVIAVSATDRYDGKASYSNYGNWIELSAPGGDGPDYHDWILSTYIGNWYAWGYGTSMATPHVSGVAALVWSYEPSLTNQELREHLRNTADDLGAPGKDDYFGYGRVNAYRALNELGTMHVESIDFKQKGGRWLDVMVTIYDNFANPVAGATVYMNITYPDASIQQVSEVTGNNGVATHKISKPAKGTYTVTVTNVTHAMLTYDPSANKETTDSYTVT